MAAINDRRQISQYLLQSYFIDILFQQEIHLCERAFQFLAEQIISTGCLKVQSTYIPNINSIHLFFPYNNIFLSKRQ